MSLITQPIPWFVAGPLIALILYLLLRMGKSFGMSSNLRTLCAISGGDKLSDFFKFDWKAQRWNLVVAFGVFVGAFLTFEYLNVTAPNINAESANDLIDLGFNSVNENYLPTELFSLNSLLSLKGFFVLLIAGFLVGFGTRYAGGCTSGHAISGLSNLQLPSLIAVIGFFIGGLIMVHLLMPLIF